MGRRLRSGIAAATACLLLLGGFVAFAQPSSAAIQRAFSQRFQLNAPGDVIIRGNSLMTCPTSAANCTAARTSSASTLTDNNNNVYAMEFVDQDSDPGTSSSSLADVQIPSGATVRFAGLYWSGYTTSSQGKTAPSSGSAGTIKFRAPGGSYQAVTTSDVTTIPAGSNAGVPYLAFADVTGQVQTSGAYAAADIYASTGTDAYAGWSLVIAYTDPSQPRRSLTVFDGFGQVTSGDPSLQIPLTGFQTPPSGQVDARLGAVTFEGDYGYTGDHLSITPQGGSAQPQSNGTNPADNVFNSTVTDDGTDVAGRNPTGNTFGVDADVFHSTVDIPAAASQATLTMDTTQDAYFPAVATIVANLYAPELDINQVATVQNGAQGSRTRPGDRILYTLDVTNNGQADAQGSVVDAAIPSGTAYVPGSLTLDGTTLTDGANDDVGDVDSSAVHVRVGTGANSSTGGTVAPNGTTRITFLVEITSPYTTGGTITGSSTSSYHNSANTLNFVTPSNSAGTTVDPASADLAVTQTANPTVVQTNGNHQVTWTATVTNNGPEDEPQPVLAEALPAGATGLSASNGSCTVSGTTYTCPLAALASGASTQVQFTATLPANAPDPSTATASVSGQATDPTSGNNSATTDVGVNQPPAAVADTAALPAPGLTVDADVLANDSDPEGNPLSIGTLATPGHGTATVVAGKVRYTLTDRTFIGDDTFTYQSCDSRGGCTTQTLTVAVANHRTAGLSVSQTANPAVAQRSGPPTVTWTALVSNGGPDAEPAAVLTETLPANVTGVSITGASCSPAGSTYTCPLGQLASGASRQVQFTATLPANASDPSAGTATVTGQSADPNTSDNTATTTVGVNGAPVVSSPATGNLPAPNPSVDLDVVAGATDPDNDPMTLTAVSTPAHGTAAIVGGKLRYTLTDRTFVGDETVDYTICDDRGGCITRTATITVADHRTADLALTNVPTPAYVQRAGPRAVTWTATVTNNGPEAEPSPLLIQALPNDITGLTITGATCTSSSTTYSCPLPALAAGASAQVVFSATLPVDAPDPAPANASVTGSVTDAVLSNNAATAYIGVNRPPVAADDTATLGAGDLSTDVDVLGNDSDPDTGDPLTITQVSTPAHGTAQVVGGELRYTLTDTSFSGVETITYTACDTRAGCVSATLTLTVAEHRIADLGVTQDVSPALLQRGGSRVVTWTATVRNAGPETEPSPVLTEALPDGATGVSVSGATCTGSGSSRSCALPALASGASAVVAFTATLPATAPDPSAATATVSGAAADPEPADDTDTTRVAVNSAPTANPDTTTLLRGTSEIVIPVRANDSDADADPMTITAISQPAHGRSTIAGGSVRYVLTDSSFTGDDTFAYAVCDGRGGCATTSVTVKVANHGGAPAAYGDAWKTQVGVVATIPVLANDSDPEHAALTLDAITTAPRHGTAAVSGDKVVYTPAAGYIGTDSLVYRVCDPTGLCSTATVSITVTSRPPAVIGDAARLRPGGSVFIDVLGNDSDPDGRRLSVSIATQPRIGKASVTSDGRIRYTAPAGTPAGTVVSFSYRSCNPTGACSLGTVRLTVSGAPLLGSGGGRGGNGTGLAYTGGDIGPIILLGLLLLAAGGIALAAGRRDHPSP